MTVDKVIPVIGPMPGFCTAQHLVIFGILQMLLTSVMGDLETIYMDTRCGQDIGQKVGARIETSEALTYSHGMDCTMTVSAPTGKTFRIWFMRWDVEMRLYGVCRDYLVLYDGSSTAATALSSQLCEDDVQVITAFNYTTSQQALTLHFVTDADAKFRGFEILIAAFTDGTCSGDEFSCTNGICLDSSLKCDNVDQCWDNSDEASCSNEEQKQDKDKKTLAIIIGCSAAGLVVLLILIIIIYKVIKYYYWKRWLERNQHRKYPWEEQDSDLYQYPKTDKYQVFDIGKKGRRPPQLPSYFSNTGFTVADIEDGDIEVHHTDYSNIMGENL